MAVRLGKGVPFLRDGQAIEDFEPLPTGVLQVLPRIMGIGGCTLEIGTPYQR